MNGIAFTSTINPAPFRRCANWLRPLLDIHGQHEQQTLLDNSSQLDLIDAFADSTDSRMRKSANLLPVPADCRSELAELRPNMLANWSGSIS